MSQNDGFERFVNTELPKRLSTTENPLDVTAKKIPISVGSGLAVAFVNATVFKTQVLELDKVENTADLDKPVSTAVQEALDAKLDKSDVRDQIADIISDMGFVIDPDTGDLILDEGELQG